MHWCLSSASGHRLVACLWVLMACLFSPWPSWAFDRTNVPLKNWGGFSVNRSSVYDALEKVVLAGLADQALLNTKPLSRVEAARIVAQAVRRLDWDKYGDYNHRGYLEDVIYQLVEEFGAELAEMGVKTPLNREASPGFFGITPVDHAQFGIAFAGRKQSVVNNFGNSASKGSNPYSTLDGRAHAGDFFSLYYQPEFSSDGDSYQGRMRTGYGKLTFWNTELEVGRDSLWWGPGFRGSMLFSTNAAPLDQVRLSAAEPFRLPWLLSYLGPMKATLLAARLEKDRDFSNSYVGGYRLNLAPWRFLEIGHGRGFQFGGEGRGFKGRDFPRIVFTQGSDDPTSPININNLVSYDATLRIPEVDRYVPLTRDMALYFEVGWDDTHSGYFIPDKPGGTVGAYLAGFLGDPKLDLRFEYTQTSDIMFTHSLYTSGFAYKGSALSHFVGTKGSEIFLRASRWINPDLLVGFQSSRAEIGPTASGLLGLPREKRDSFGFDVSYRVTDRSSIFLGYDFARIKDRGFVAGRTGNDNLFRFEYTRSFGK